MTLLDSITIIKALIEADSWFNGLANPSGDVLLVEDLMPADQDFDDEYEKAISDENRGAAVLGMMATGEPAGSTEEVREMSSFLIAVIENRPVCRTSNGFNKKALQIMQRIKSVLQHANFQPGEGETIKLSGYSLIDPETGIHGYEIEIKITSNED